MEANSQRRCPRCGTPVARRAETCLLCGAHLKERRERRLPAPQGDLWLPLLLAAALVVLWVWKPWATGRPQAWVPTPLPPTATPRPTATRIIAPTATPLHSPTPPPTATLPPNQVLHTVEPNETVSTIAKKYGTTARAILEANQLKEHTILKVGQQLIIPLPVADTPTPTPTLTPSPTPFLYTVRSGDNLSAIAKKFGTTVEALMQANGLTNASTLQVGTRLIIVQPPDYWATMAYETYEVQPGDTLYTIAARYKIAIAQIKEANGLTSDRLNVGQKLRIPIGTATPTAPPTPTSTLTPTPSPPRPAPALLTPPDGASFEGAEATIVLNWASVGILKPEEWYVVRLERLSERTKQLPLVWTRATSWRVPAELYGAGQARPLRFRWQVLVMRRTGTAEDGTWLGQVISPPGEARTFFWK